MAGQRLTPRRSFCRSNATATHPGPAMLEPTSTIPVRRNADWAPALRDFPAGRPRWDDEEDIHMTMPSDAADAIESKGTKRGPT